MSDLNLYKITEKINELDGKILESGGEVTEETESLLKDLSELLNNKVGGCVGYVKKQNDLLTRCNEEIKNLNSFKNSITKKLEYFDTYVISCLKNNKAKEFTNGISVIKLRKPAKVLEITNSKSIPVDFIEVVKTPDKVKVLTNELKAALKNGLEVDGVKLINGQQKVIYK